MAHERMDELERIEHEAWEDLARAAPPGFTSAVGLETHRIGQALFLMARRVPHFQFNWVGAVGIAGDRGEALSEGVKRFRETGVVKAFVMIPPSPEAETYRVLAAREGLVEHPMAWAKFIRGTSNPPRIEGALEVREVGADERDLFASTVVAGFGMPEQMAVWLREIVGRPRWKTYVSFDGGKPAGGGALFIDGGWAWLGIGATKPDGRKKGGQSAVLARRIADAARAGAKFACTETGVPQPGEPAPSYSNILKAGFEVAYVRANWTFKS